MTPERRILLEHYRSGKALEAIERYGFKGAQKRIIQAAVRGARRHRPDWEMIERAEALIRPMLAPKERPLPMSEEEIAQLQERWERQMRQYAPAEGRKSARSRKASLYLMMLAAILAIAFLWRINGAF